MRTLALILSLICVNAFGTTPAEVAKLRKLADQGDSVAQLALGECYYYGDGVTENEKEAFKWFSKSAEQGNAKGLLNVGFCYADGKGVQKDIVEAFAYYNLAANSENSAKKWRDMYIQNKLTPDQLQAGRKRSKEIEANIVAKKAGK